MAHATRSMLSALVVACLCYDSASGQEAGSRWWPFARRQDPAPTNVAPIPSPQIAPSAPTAASTAVTPVGPQGAPQFPPGELPVKTSVPERPWMFQSFAFPTVNVPKPRMPQFWPNRSQIDDTRNAWAGQNPAPEPPSPFQAVRDGAQRVGDSTRAAWHKTVDTLTPGPGLGSSSPPSIADGGVHPPLWKRMFGISEPPPQGPRTVTEWMAQDRLDP